MQHFATRETGVTGFLWRDMRIETTCTEQGLGKAMDQQSFADVIGAGEQVGMTHLLCGESAAQQVNGVFVTDDVPAGLWRLMQFHGDMVAEIGENGKLIILQILYTT